MFSFPEKEKKVEVISYYILVTKKLRMNFSMDENWNENLATHLWLMMKSLHLLLIAIMYKWA